MSAEINFPPRKVETDAIKANPAAKPEIVQTKTKAEKVVMPPQGQNKTEEKARHVGDRADRGGISRMVAPSHRRICGRRFDLRFGVGDNRISLGGVRRGHRMRGRWCLRVIGSFCCRAQLDCTCAFRRRNIPLRLVDIRLFRLQGSDKGHIEAYKMGRT